ncbi:ComEA family DNA-binding protein [Thalassotalea sp. PS06]|uniref:ComEA family DNA-binding protein n=1 Tax=Thalassotalea sp. PS06 TaxID=2594005 RepID=UPI0011656422|nr:helix-hairpin-helix domain-containing protein [Thalassotalea sp. PS06]QDP01125.1 helix-hairpin-helix domain-containing protein [Thalassotalea sp. PS06]
MYKLLLVLVLGSSLFTAYTAPVNAATKVEKTTIVESVNLNKAGIDELRKIRGLGATKAQAIIDYRKANGPFTDVKQLLNVKGIGEKFLAKNAKLLSI